jgi:hypothetical protein
VCVCIATELAKVVAIAVNPVCMSVFMYVNYECGTYVWEEREREGMYV